MSSTIRILLCTWLFLNALLVLNAQLEFRVSDSYGKETGLNSAPTCIAEDNEGRFWAGTGVGLNHFA